MRSLEKPLAEEMISESEAAIGGAGNEAEGIEAQQDAGQIAFIEGNPVHDRMAVGRRLVGDDSLPFAFHLITNEHADSMAVVSRYSPPFSRETTVVPLELAWPAGVISLSHVALPVPRDDPLYGEWPPDDENLLFLGQMNLKGERGLLRVPADWLMRLRHNPFYDYLERRSLEWIDVQGAVRLEALGPAPEGTP